MQFLLDMGISPKTGKFLIQRGYDTVHLIDIGMERLSDIQILKKSLDEKRILLTHDLDFGQLFSNFWKQTTISYYIPAYRYAPSKYK